MSKYVLSAVTFKGLFRPKQFIKIKTGSLARYVNASPFLLRFRLARAKAKLQRTERKLAKFTARRADVVFE